MTSTTYGYKKPDTGDLSKGTSGWMADLNYNWDRLDGHSHNGVDSSTLSYFKGGTATGSYNQLTLPSNTTAALTALARVAGNIYYSSDAQSAYLDNGTSLVALSTQTPFSPTVPTFTKLTATNGATNYRFTVTAANATVGATYTNNAQTFTVLATISGGTTLLCSGTGTPAASGNLTKSTGTGDSTIAFSAMTCVFIPSSTALYLRVKMVGGGGGGGGSGATAPVAGGTGGTTSLGTSILTCTGGGGGATDAAPTGGTATIAGTGVSGIALAGGGGDAGQINNTSAYSITIKGGMGAASPFGGAGVSAGHNTAGTDAAANSGSGGGGGSHYNTATWLAGSGGAAGGYIEAIVTGSTLATWIASGAAYAVGAAGTAGTGTENGGKGGDGLILIETCFQ